MPHLLYTSPSVSKSKRTKYLKPIDIAMYKNMHLKLFHIAHPQPPPFFGSIKSKSSSSSSNHRYLNGSAFGSTFFTMPLASRSSLLCLRAFIRPSSVKSILFSILNTAAVLKIKMRMRSTMISDQTYKQTRQHPSQ